MTRNFLTLCYLLLTSVLLLPLQAAVPAGTDVSQLNKGNNIEHNYRHRSFCAYKPLHEVSGAFRIGAYSAYENPTGLFFSAGETIHITVHNRPEGSLNLVVRDFRKDGWKESYPLTEGENTIELKNNGLGYIDYRSSAGEEAPRVTLSINGGVFNGIFSRHDDNTVWQRLLAQAPAGILDIIGERCQVIYDTDGLRRGNPDKGKEMLALYDRIVQLEQEIMGWDAEGIHPGNHILCRVVWNGYMRADGEGAAFNASTTADISNPEGLRREVWAVAHELGHVNQMKPDFCWAGMMEVSNNVYSTWCNHILFPDFSRLEHETTPNTEGTSMRGGRFDCYVNNAIVNRHLWNFTGGPDSGVGRMPTGGTGDHFVSVCPLWQLQLYCHVARGNENFYPAIFRALRAQDGRSMTHGQLRVNFCRHALDSSKYNLNEFFLHTGMLGIMNRYVGDYGSHMVTVTEKMALDALHHGRKYPEPDSSVIYYINANNVGIYRERLAVEPSPDFCPAIPEEGGHIVFPAEKWKNAVAFEVYTGKRLVRICLRGLGQADNASTTVICPAGATAIRAVQWDGKRHTVVSK